MESAALSVTQLNERIQALVGPLGTVRVEGEVSGARPSNGHLYFDLKDSGAKVRVTVWRSALGRIGLQVRDGMQVVVTGRVDVWVQGGSYALSAVGIERAGLGAQFAKLQALKEALAAEGLFDASRKRALPVLPRAVGLVTSPSGAALRDMLRILHDRFPVRVVLAPAKVQGEGAAESLVAALQALDRSGLVDVILLGRGGGSLEDLWCFHDERLVRAVAACRTPVVSAVGHETDTLLTDFAADVRAPTPTAAAELVVPVWAELVAGLANARQRMAQRVAQLLTNERRHWGQLQSRLGDGGPLTGHRWLGLDDARRRLAAALARQLAHKRRGQGQLNQRLHAAHPSLRLAGQRRRLDALQARLTRAHDRLLPPRRQALERLSALLAAMSPRAALQRGYGIVRRQDGSALRSTAGVEVGERLEVLFAVGALDVRVEKVT